MLIGLYLIPSFPYRSFLIFIAKLAMLTLSAHYEPLNSN